ILPNFLQHTKNHMIIDVAGKFAEEKQWLELGLNGTIFAGQDLIKKIQQLIHVKKKGVSGYEA
ncbi:MAG: hypothetical protein WBG45_09500, partial [Paenisporosarcina sp.]